MIHRVLTLGAALFTVAALADPLPALEIFDLHRRQAATLQEAVVRVQPGHIVLVGESHTAAEHHTLQLALIQALVEAGRRVVVGMEMFRRDSQAHLDAWVAGGLPEERFAAVYADNWSYPWELYRPILLYARDRGLSVLGLNVPRAVTRQVARSGFASLSPEQRGRLPATTCEVSDDYRDFIREAHGAHGHGGMPFEHFCEAQLVWDQSMAITALEALAANPAAVVVILAGSGHARKGGIPAQIARRGTTPVTVFLPEVPGSLDPESVDARSADFLVRLPAP
jgi:uncharacterized iron-regulated protein